MASTNTLVDPNEQTPFERKRERLEAVDLDILNSFDEAQVDGEPDFIVELIDLYLDEAPRLFNAVREGLAHDDWLSAKRAAHSLRGSSSNLGIPQMALIAGDLEYLAANEEVAAEQLLCGLEDEFTRVENVLLMERQRRTP
jgi:HPt (histidine-containing phosphotransfer) domain-containing protein